MSDQNLNFIKKHIYTIRGIKVMLDVDLAEIYGYPTKALNQQVKNNIQKFDDDFRFQLTKEEYHVIKSIEQDNELLYNTSKHTENEKDIILRSKILTSKSETRGGRQYLPYAFTEQGIYMLMTVLKGDLATQQSKALVRAFKEMKDLIFNNRILPAHHELLQLALQTAQNSSDIAKIKLNMVSKNDLAKVVNKFIDPQAHYEYLILNGETVESNLAYSKIYQTAQYSVFVIDNYINLKTLALLKVVEPHITTTIFSDNIGHGLHQTDLNDFKQQYPHIHLNFQQTCGKFHDRYIVLDYNTNSERIFHCGASSKDAGKKINTIIEVTDRQVYHQIIDELHSNPKLSF